MEAAHRETQPSPTGVAFEDFINATCRNAGTQPILQGAKSLGERVLGLMLMQAIDDSASEIRFTIGRDEISADCKIDGSLHRYMPPPQILAREIREALYKMFGVRSRFFSEGGTKLTSLMSKNGPMHVELILTKKKHEGKLDFAISIRKTN